MLGGRHGADQEHVFSEGVGLETVGSCPGVIRTVEKHPGSVM